MNKVLVVLSAISLLFACQGNKGKQQKEVAITIDLWYGDTQEFGQLGLPQKWINILGNVQSEKGIKDFTYTLNESEPKALSLGSDLHRLAAQGDFNVEMDVGDCLERENKLVLLALDSVGNTFEKEVTFILHKDRSWKLPYRIDWSEVQQIQDVVQVVDGNWEINKIGLHNVDTYYDRVVAFGDDSWKNYEVSTTATFHDFTTPQTGPPTYNVSHAAIATRWTGHDQDGLQPTRKWYPLGATAEFRLTAGLDSCRWRIFDGPKPDATDFYVEQPIDHYRTIVLNKVYGMKHRVETIGRDSTLYSVKLWPFDQAEPTAWDLIGIEVEENFGQGSALFLAHNTSVTFGDVSVTALEK